ncbi:MAG: biosynthetic arginine decarboxylase [Planctomycetota bacterium]
MTQTPIKPPMRSKAPLADPARANGHEVSGAPELGSPNAAGGQVARASSDQRPDPYGIERWGRGFLRVGTSGHLELTPSGDGTGPTIDLHELVEGLAERGVHTPVLLRFNDVLRARMRAIKSAFDRAITEEEYHGSFAGVFPIKVNQQRQVCEQVLEIGASLGFGLEAGSKPELLAVLGLTAETADASSGGVPIVCNGFKDQEYIETVVLAKKLGRDIVPVVEQSAELPLILDIADRYGVKPRIGIRVKPSARGAGRWAESAGAGSKFGLTALELVHAVELLRDRGMLDRLNLLHFHIGSQICDIRRLSAAIDELARTYVELRRLGAGLDTIDIGGGLGVDYDGSNSSRDSSINYSLDEYAIDVVHRIRTASEDAGQPHPSIVAECGRAMVAHASVLITEVIGRSGREPAPQPEWVRSLLSEDDPTPPFDLLEAYEASASIRSPGHGLGLYHDAMRAHEQCISLYTLGYLSLPVRAAADAMCREVQRRVLDSTDEETRPHELAELPDRLHETFFVNCSVFQSMPDAWAIDQVFPVCPIQRLDEDPPLRGILADMTCDSDGKIDLFADPESGEPSRALPMHEQDEQPYYMGVFLVGAYQEVLGDLHNLFGDTHAVHISMLDTPGAERESQHAVWAVDELVEGDTVREVLSYVQYDPDGLRRAMRADVERAMRNRTLSAREGAALLSFYDAGLAGYTYLE